MTVINHGACFFFFFVYDSLWWNIEMVDICHGGGWGVHWDYRGYWICLSNGYTDGFSNSPRLFAQQVAQGALQRSLQRAPCHHERSSEQGTP